jgi:hypothetical protein
MEKAAKSMFFRKAFSSPPMYNETDRAPPIKKLKIKDAKFKVKLQTKKTLINPININFQ